MSRNSISPVRRRQFLQAAGVTAGTLAFGGVGSVAAREYQSEGKQQGSATYRVTVANLTRGQAFTPPAVAVHRPSVEVFSVGEPASEAVKEIAENGNLDPLGMAIESSRDIVGAAIGDAPLVPATDPGDTGQPYTTTLTVTADRSAKYLSFISMLIATNDGFTGLDTVRLPAAVNESKSLYAASFDAGTEMNTESFADLVPPAQSLIGVTGDAEGTGTSDPAIAEDGVVMPHAGITGGSDLRPDVHGWTDPVALVHVERVE
ncbi:hypothetical protein AUR64_15875 [Haloprofundus marisrubri]|uniref:Spondin domain-containing protein n=1 Tax=Haloprofundus marisrubri TaxID=1514971 RepID=A0A0W1R7U1_9EURY|nr:spondin domain-containing protein [Haloprofundus marisrubri]KTG09264.1 hypothetical protein AUR64_15875 [Haloprofundus marisrubri]